MPSSSPSTLSAMIPRTFQIFQFLLLFLLLLLCKSGSWGRNFFRSLFLCVTWKRSFRQKTSTSNCFPFLDFRLSVSFCVIHHPWPTRRRSLLAAKKRPWLAQCGKLNANSFVVVFSCCAAYLELRKLSGMNGGEILPANKFSLLHFSLWIVWRSFELEKGGTEVADVWINRLKRSRQRKQIPP